MILPKQPVHKPPGYLSKRLRKSAFYADNLNSRKGQKTIKLASLNYFLQLPTDCSVFLLFFKITLYCKKLDKIELLSTKKHLQFNDILSADQDSSERNKKRRAVTSTKGTLLCLSSPLGIPRQMLSRLVLIIALQPQLSRE